MDSENLTRLVEIREMAASGEARLIREKARVSVAELAEIVGINRTTLWSWESGQHTPRGEKALEWQKTLTLLQADERTA